MDEHGTQANSRKHNIVAIAATSVVVFLAFDASNRSFYNLIRPPEFFDMPSIPGMYGFARFIIELGISLVLSIQLVSVAPAINRSMKIAAVALMPSKLFGSKQQENSSPEDVERLSGNVRLAYLNMQSRIAELSSRSSLIYWTMVATLVAGVILIIFAGKLASLDSTLGTLRSEVNSEWSTLLSSIENDKEAFRHLQRDEIAAQREIGLQSIIRQNAENKTTNPVLAPTQLANPPESTELKDELETLSSDERNITSAIIDGARQNSDKSPGWNWPSTVLRVGIIGLLVFMVQILISLYRYNSRLLVFYISRRDCLLLAGENESKMKDYITIFYPQHLDFGQEPRHPFVEAAELFRRGGSAGRRTNTNRAKSPRDNADKAKEFGDLPNDAGVEITTHN